MAQQGQGQGQAAQEQGGGGGWATTVFRWIMMYYCINFFMSKWRGDPKPPIQTNEDGTPIEVPISQLPHAPLWKPNTFYNLRCVFYFVLSAINNTSSLHYIIINLYLYPCTESIYQRKKIYFLYFMHKMLMII